MYQRPISACCLVQELIAGQAPLQAVLRLMVLVTLTAGGIPKKYFDPLRREVLHTYGHENILTLSRLQAAGDTLVRQLACVAELHDKCHRQGPQQSIPVCNDLATTHIR